MIKVCEHCSNIDVVELKKVVGEENVQVGCLGNCAAYKTEAYGIYKDELLVKNSSKEWIDQVSK